QRGEIALGDDGREVGTGRDKNAVIRIELTIGEPEAVVGAQIEPAGVRRFYALAQDVRGRADVAGDTVEELHEVVGARIEGRLAFLEAGVEGAQLGDRFPVNAGGGTGRTAPAAVPGGFAPGEGGARILQVLVDLRGAAHAAERVDQFGGGAAHHLIDAELEGGLVVKERRVLPLDAEQADLGQHHGGNPCVLVDVEVDQIGRGGGDCRRLAGGSRLATY